MGRHGGTIWTVILAGGSGSRLANATGGLPKQFLDWRGAPLYWQSALLFARCAVDGLVFVFPAECVDAEQARITALMQHIDVKLPWKAVGGGALRQDSVRKGLAALPDTCTQVLIHDAARPFASSALVNRVLERLHKAPGVVPGVPVTDTIKTVQQGVVTATPDRNTLVAVQTPQGFDLTVLLQAHAVAERESWTVTDDASVLERCGYPVCVVEGELENRKITTPKDLEMLDTIDERVPCVGYGYDVHRYAQEPAANARPMRLGNVLIPESPAVLAHSDGDVLLHALMDALLGCVGAGDIGQHFPDTDPAYENSSSAMLLENVLALVRPTMRITHVDLTIIAQIPKINPHREKIRTSVAALLGLETTAVNLKATTEEGLGFTGEGLGIKAVAVVTGLR
ncbi:MAG: 2-C-methyl-D-erythritol 4-phosphate cytidylyltransferase [Bilophila sp.]